MNKNTIFDIIDLFDGNSLDIIEEERIKEVRKRIERDSKNAKWKRLSFIERKSIEKGRICQNCGTEKYIRWCLDNEWFLCYDCYYESMGEAGEFYSYHGRRAEDMDGFIYDDEWEELWEEENGIEEYEDEKTETEIEREENISSVVSLFDVFSKDISGGTTEITLDMIRHGY